MKLYNGPLTALILLSLFLPTVAGMPAHAQEPVPPEPGLEDSVPEPVTTFGNRITFGDKMVIQADTVHRGSITCLAGELEIEGTVLGDVVTVGGDFRLDGTVQGDVVSVLSDVSLTESTRIRGSLVAVAGSMDDRGATIERDRVNIPLGLSLPGLGHPVEILVSIFLWWALLGLILMFFALLVLAALVPERLELISEEFPVRWPAALFLGLAFSVIGMPLIYILLTISLIGIPLIPFAFFTFVVLKWMGIAGFFVFVGRKLATTTGRRIAVLPAVLLGFLVFGLVKLIPIIGFLVWLLLGWLGIGLILLTRFGTHRRQVPMPPPVQAIPED